MANRNLDKKKKSRATYISSNNDDVQEIIRKKAFELFEKRGYAHGNDLVDWLEAEKIIKYKI